MDGHKNRGATDKEGTFFLRFGESGSSLDLSETVSDVQKRRQVITVILGEKSFEPIRERFRAQE